MSDHRRHPAPSSWLLVLRLSIASVGAAGGETGVSPIATTRTPLSTPPACMGERGGMRLRA